jgi:hypothetical protein
MLWDDLPVDLPQAKCEKCGQTEWADATDEQYAAMAARLRRLANDPEFRPEGQMQVCQGCGALRSVLTQTFGA